LFRISSLIFELYVLGDEADKLFPGMDKRLISKAKVSDVVWQHLVTVAKRGKLHDMWLGNFTKFSP
jgi:hypothetical protein